MSEEIESREDFRDDVILEVSKPTVPEDKTYRFLDTSGIPIRTTVGPDPLLEPEHFLNWLEMKFGQIRAC